MADEDIVRLLEPLRHQSRGADFGPSAGCGDNRSPAAQGADSAIASRPAAWRAGLRGHRDVNMSGITIQSLDKLCSYSVYEPYGFISRQVQAVRPRCGGGLSRTHVPTSTERWKSATVRCRSLQYGGVRASE